MRNCKKEKLLPQLYNFLLWHHFLKTSQKQFEELGKSTDRVFWQVTTPLQKGRLNLTNEYFFVNRV